MTYPDAVRRAGHADGEALFEAILEPAIRHRVHPRRVRRRLRPDRPPRRPDRARAAGDARWPGGDRRGAGHSHNRRLPLVLSVGERRSFTANTSSATRAGASSDAGGRLRISPEDAARLGLVDGGARALRRRAVAPSASSRSATRCARDTSRFRTGSASTTRADGEPMRHGRRAERAHLTGLARPVRRHAVAQARAGQIEPVPA